jgi:DNA-binding HxlR family transcriptional regulator
MTAESEPLGLLALQLLAEDWMVSVLRGLADGPMRPGELEGGLPHAAHSVVVRRLRRLLESELVGCERQPGVPPRLGSAAVPRRTYYSLTDAGRMLLEVTAEADRWEQAWCSQLERGVPPGIVAIGLSANRRTRMIMLALADGPLAVRDLQARLPELRRSTLRRRLSNLILGGLLEHQEVAGVERYRLTARARQLATVAMLAGRWEWQWSRPEYVVPGTDLIDLLQVIAPMARVSKPTAGVCQLHFDADGAAAPAIYLAASAGSIRTHLKAPATPPEAVGRATPEAWCDALLLPDRRITVDGNHRLMLAVLGALNDALRANLREPPLQRAYKHSER